MKLPFSYRNHFFSPILLSSLLGHLVFFGGDGLFFSPSKFAVQQAPSSVEIVILEEPKVRKERHKTEAVLTAKDLANVSEEVFQKSEERPRKSAPKSVVIPSHKGALEDMNPAYLKNPAPIYPRRAQEAGWQGLVILEALVQSDGRPARIKVLKSSGYKILDESALKAVQKWQFLPARVGNFPFSSWVKIPVRFVLIKENP